MSNILILDECKGSDNTIFCFGSIVYKNETIFSQLENELNTIKNSKGCHNEIKSNVIGNNISPFYKDLLESLFSKLMTEIRNGNLSVRFFIMKNDMQYGTQVNLENVLNELLMRCSDTSINDIQKNFYYQLDSFLVRSLHSLPLHNGFISKVICDNTYGLANNNNKLINAHGNIFEVPIPLSNAMALIIQSLHNAIPGHVSHNGLEHIVFHDSRDFISIQLCDILSNFMFSSLRYMFFLKNGLTEDANKYLDKYNFISSYIDLSNLPLNSIPITIFQNSNGSQIDISCNSHFEPIGGILC